MTDDQFLAKIVKLVKMSQWKEITALGINQQMALKIRAGKPFKFRQTTLDRLRKKLKVA